MSYDGQPITYDPIGNPLNYLGYNMTWQRGRQLASLRGNGVTAGYRYNADGMRVNKTVNGVAFKYYYEGTQLLAEERGSDFLQFYYSGGGIPVAFNLNGVVYYYQINSRGDITGIYDANGTLVVEYTYDAWGNPTGITGSMADTVGQMNPLRYRGYYYDAETGFYQLQSRYYDPQIGRFLNPDGQLNPQEGISGFNMFQYCGNNPVNRLDPTGHAWWHWAIGAAIVVACAVAVVVVVTAGGAAPAIAAIASVGSGVAAATTASTIAAGAFIGSSMALAGSALIAASDSKNMKQFNAKGNWSTVVNTGISAVIGAGMAYSSTKKSGSVKNTVTSSKSNSSSVAPTPSKSLTPARFNDNQNAVIQLAKENRKGMSMDTARILESWGKEYGVRAEIHMGHPTRPSIISQNPHFHFGNGSDHVPIFPE